MPVQLAVSDDVTGLRIELVDPLQEDLDGAPLAQLLADPAVEVVVHAGRQDVALLRRRLRTQVRALFDTQVAAGFAGMAAQTCYETLLRELLGVRVPKTASFTRWDARPLDARAARVRARGRPAPAGARGGAARGAWPPPAAWSGRWRSAARSSSPPTSATSRRSSRGCRVSAAWAPPRRPSRASWSRGASALRPSEDRTVQSVLNDAALVEIAKRRPATARELGEIRGVNAGQPAPTRRGSAGAVGRGAERAADGRPLLERLPRLEPPDPADGPLVALGEALVRARALEAGLAYELIAARADLQAVVAASHVGGAEPDVRTLRGWRRDLVGEELLELLDGRRVAVGARRAARGRPSAHLMLLYTLNSGRYIEITMNPTIAADEDDHHRLDDRRQRLDGGRHAILVEVGDLVEHPVQLTGLLAHADHVADHHREDRGSPRAARRSCRRA